jgi:hypothetical protein
MLDNDTLAVFAKEGMAKNETRAVIKIDFFILILLDYIDKKLKLTKNKRR